VCMDALVHFEQAVRLSTHFDLVASVTMNHRVKAGWWPGLDPGAYIRSSFSST
jgi:hypothetical protein